MKIAFLYGAFSLGNPPPPDRLFDFPNLLTSKRGLTGSELSCLAYADAMQKRGHHVNLFVPQEPCAWGKIPVRPLSELKQHAGYFDVVYSWNEPDLLRDVPAKSLRLVNQQLNDFTYCQPGWEEHVDIVTSPSECHRDYLKKFAPGVRQWGVVPNGCSVDVYDPSRKVPGRVVYISSPDRGLHLVLQEWGRIRRAVPTAHLRVYYHGLDRWLTYMQQFGESHPNRDLAELGQRARYIASIKARAETNGVEFIGGVSRAEMVGVLSEAQILAYPCDTVRFTEGFSVSTLEGCASGALPIISECDALGSIYEHAAPMVKAPARLHMAEWREIVIRYLATDAPVRDYASTIARQFSRIFDWKKLGEELERFIEYELHAHVHAGTRVPDPRSVNAFQLAMREYEVAARMGIKPATELRGPTREETRKFRGHAYKLACTDFPPKVKPDDPHQHPSWYSFDDEQEVRERHWDVARGDYVLDVGAAYGSYTLAALACGAQQVWAWSPQGPKGELPERDFLQASLRLNSRPHFRRDDVDVPWTQNCEVYDWGVYDRPGWIDTDTQEFYSAQPRSKDGGLAGHPAVIRVEMIDCWLDGQNAKGALTMPAFANSRWWMKLDVEGAEVHVLKGAPRFIREMRPRILVECHLFKGASLERDVRALLEGEMGYRHVATHPHHGVCHAFFMPKEGK